MKQLFFLFSIFYNFALIAAMVQPNLDSNFQEIKKYFNVFQDLSEKREMIREVKTALLKEIKIKELQNIKGVTFRERQFLKNLKLEKESITTLDIQDRLISRKMSFINMLLKEDLVEISGRNEPTFLSQLEAAIGSLKGEISTLADIVMSDEKEIDYKKMREYELLIDIRDLLEAYFLKISENNMNDIMAEKDLLKYA